MAEDRSNHEVLALAEIPALDDTFVNKTKKLKITRRYDDNEWMTDMDKKHKITKRSEPTLKLQARLTTQRSISRWLITKTRVIFSSAKKNAVCRASGSCIENPKDQRKDRAR